MQEQDQKLVDGERDAGAMGSREGADVSKKEH